MDRSNGLVTAAGGGFGKQAPGARARGRRPRSPRSLDAGALHAPSAAQKAEAAAPAGAGDIWCDVFDPPTGLTYYWNARTGVTQWEPPHSSAHRSGTARSPYLLGQPGQEGSPSRRDGWVSVQGGADMGGLYYWRPATGERIVRTEGTAVEGSAAAAPVAAGTTPPRGARARAAAASPASAASPRSAARRAPHVRRGASPGESGRADASVPSEERRRSEARRGSGRVRHIAADAPYSDEDSDDSVARAKRSAAARRRQLAAGRVPSVDPTQRESTRRRPARGSDARRRQRDSASSTRQRTSRGTAASQSERSAPPPQFATRRVVHEQPQRPPTDHTGSGQRRLTVLRGSPKSATKSPPPPPPREARSAEAPLRRDDATSGGAAPQTEAAVPLHTPAYTTSAEDARNGPFAPDDEGAPPGVDVAESTGSTPCAPQSSPPLVPSGGPPEVGDATFYVTVDPPIPVTDVTEVSDDADGGSYTDDSIVNDNAVLDDVEVLPAQEHGGVAASRPPAINTAVSSARSGPPTVAMTPGGDLLRGVSSVIRVDDDYEDDDDASYTSPSTLSPAKSSSAAPVSDMHHASDVAVVHGTPSPRQHLDGMSPVGELTTPTGAKSVASSLSLGASAAGAGAATTKRDGSTSVAKAAVPAELLVRSGGAESPMPSPTSFLLAPRSNGGLVDTEAEPEPEPESDVPPLEPGQTFREAYKLDKTLGTGSFATVYLAIHRDTGRSFAVKVVDKRGMDEAGSAALGREVRILRDLNHPHVVKLLSFHASDTAFYLRMEHLRGGELLHRITAKTTYTEKEARDVIRTLTSAVAYLHDNSIVHRDLKPENLLYVDESPDSKLKIVDFGLAVANVEAAHDVAGTAQYIAPEVLSGSHTHGAPVDVWALGVITYILLCGYPPFYAEDPAVMLASIRDDEVKFDPEAWEGVSAAAVDLCTKMLNKDPSKRLTAKQTLAHPFLAAKRASLGGRDLARTRAALVRFNARRKLKAAIRAVKTTVRMKMMLSATKLSAASLSPKAAGDA